MMPIINPQPWTELAPCRNRWDRFDAEAPGPRRRGREGRTVAGMFRAEIATCAACPVLDECRQYAIETEPTAGIWAGEVIRGERTARAAIDRMRRAVGLPPAEQMREAV